MNLLFLCTGNSCRSQMAEGWARALGDRPLGVRSAGIESHGQNPRAISIMADAGVDISSQDSSKLDDATLRWADYVVTVCGHADERCPLLSANTRKEHWPLSDPARASGTEEDILSVFRESRDEIGVRVDELLRRLGVRREAG
ncbi:MAG: arsenate reductase (thioredoxin) [Candidatus Rariloculaceae bacterium]